MRRNSFIFFALTLSLLSKSPGFTLEKKHVKTSPFKKIKVCQPTMGQICQQTGLRHSPTMNPESSYNYSIVEVVVTNRNEPQLPWYNIKSISQTVSNRIRVLYNTYSDLMDARPIFTQSTTTSIFAFVSDVISQTIEARTSGIPLILNSIRFTSFAFVGFLFDGPFFHYWYELMWKLEDYLRSEFGFSKFAGTASQVFVDQTIGSILYFPAYFYAYEFAEALFSGRMPSLFIAKTKMKKELFSVMIVSWMIFPLSNFFNFYFIPKQFRIMFMNVVDLFFSIFLCFKVA